MSKTVIILLFACIYILEPGASETDSRKALPLEMEVDWSQPKFISTPRRDHAAFLGGDMKLNCRAIAVPRPYVFWYRNGEMVNESAIMPRLRFSNDNMVLMIRRIEAPDHGKWACKVWNSAGSIWRNFTVEVLDRCIYFEHVKKEDPSITFPIDCKCLWLFDGRREILAEEETGTFDKSVCSELFPTKYRQWKLKYSPASDFAPPSPAISNAGNMASGNSGNSGIPKSGHPASDTAETASDNADVIGALLDTAIDGIADNAGTNSASRNVSGTSRNDAGNGRPSVITHTLPPPQMARTIVACADSTHGHNNNNTANTNSKAQPCAAATHETVDLNTQDAAATAEWLSEVAVLPQAVAQYFSEAQQNALRVLIHKEHELPGGFEDEQEEGRISEAQLMDAMAAAGLDEEEIAVDPARQAAVDFWNVPSTENLITTTTTQIRTTTTPTSTLPPWPPRPAINSLPHIAQPPYFKDSEPEEVVKAVPSGRTVTLKCHAQGYPEPQVVFYHWVPDKEEFVEIIGTSRRPSDQTYKVRKWTLELEDVVQSDSGLYSCLAFNRYGNVTRKFKLKIVERLRSRPLISRDYPKNTSVPIGGTAEFKCPTVSDLMALIRWVKLRNSTLLDENVGLNDVWDIHYLNYAHNRSAYDYLPRFVESGGSARNVDPTLTIFNVTREDAGVYICIAGNSLGTSAAHAWLSIEEPVVASWLSPVSYAWIWISAVVILFVAVMSAVSYKCARTYTRKITPRQERLFIEADPYDEEKDTLNTPRVFVRSPTGHNYDYQDEVMRKQATDVILEYPTDHWNINPDYLSIQHLIGEGAFGTVHLGELTDPETGKTMKVAVKMSKASATVEQVKNMYGELTIMKRIGRHENIINLIAASISPGGCSLQIIVEYCANGNLRHYLIDRRPKLIEPIQEDEITESDYLVPRTQQTQPSNLTLADLVGYSRQIAKGMEYLASRKCIHRDLAARNVLVTEDLTMKVADFGLARDVGNQQPGSNKIYYRQVYNRMMPVKWLAPEALEQYKYSTEGDVWSYGILLFEIFTMGGTPYSGPGRANNIPFDHLFTSLLQGYRMPQPHGSPDEVYALMRLCWEYEPQDRPTFTQITHYLDELLQVSEPQIEPPYVDIESVQSLTTDIYDMSTPRFDMSRNDSEAFRELNNNEPNFPAKLQPMYYTNVGPDVNDTVQLLLPSTHCNRQSSSSSANTSHSSFLALNNSNSNLNPANQLGGNNGNSNNLQARSTPHINGSSSGISSAGSPMASPLGVLNAVPPTSVAALSTITERSGANSSAQTLDMAQSGDHWRHRSPTSSSEESAECEFAISNARPPPAGMRFKRRSLIIAEQFPESVETIKLPNSDSGVNLPQNDREYAKIMKPSTSRLYKNRHEDDSRYANNLEVIDGKSNSLPQDGDVVVVESARNNQQTSSASSSGRGSGMIYSSIGGADLEIEHCDTNSIVDESKEMLERQKSQYVNIGERSRPVEVVNVHMRESMI